MELGTGTEVGGGNTKPRQKVRNFCFTGFKSCLAYRRDEGMKYLCVGEEICPTTGKHHYQGFVIFINPRTLSGVMSDYIGLKLHWEIAKGTIAQNIAYCKKEGKFTEEGDIPKGSGARTDILSITTDVKNGLTDKEILDRHGDKALRVYRGVAWARQAYQTIKRDWVMDVRIYWGKPGTGKTKSVFEEFKDDIYTKMPGKWWDKYNGEKCVLIDDFDPNNCFDIQFDFYLKLLDRYPMMVEWKGGSSEFRSHCIIFTSNFDPASWFREKKNRKAFFRRVSVIECFDLELDIEDTEEPEVYDVE